MGEQTAISWCDHTFNPWIGCTKVSVGERGACEGCYAEVSTPSRAMDIRWGNHPRHRTAESTWRQPLAWNRKAEAEGSRPFVFCASLADVFDNQVPPEWRRDLFVLIRSTPHLTWLLLTKRPQNIVKLFEGALSEADKFMRVDPPLMTLAECWPRNAAIGCTVVTQPEADRDVPQLLAAKAVLKPAFAFLSMEPLMGPVDLESAWHGEDALNAECWGDCAWCDKGCPPLHNCQRGRGDDTIERSGLDWIIAGGESSQGKHRARPARPEWFRSLRDQCAAAGVPFFFKQWGEWAPGENASRAQQRTEDVAHWFDERWDFGRLTPRESEETHADDEPTVWRIGKKAAGRLLDGVLHDARPFQSHPPHPAAGALLTTQGE